MEAIEKELEMPIKVFVEAIDNAMTVQYEEYKDICRNWEKEAKEKEKALDIQEASARKPEQGDNAPGDPTTVESGDNENQIEAEIITTQASSTSVDPSSSAKVESSQAKKAQKPKPSFKWNDDLLRMLEEISEKQRKYVELEIQDNKAAGKSQLEDNTDIYLRFWYKNTFIPKAWDPKKYGKGWMGAMEMWNLGRNSSISARVAIYFDISETKLWILYLYVCVCKCVTALHRTVAFNAWINLKTGIKKKRDAKNAEKRMLKKEKSVSDDAEPPIHKNDPGKVRMESVF